MSKEASTAAFVGWLAKAGRPNHGAEVPNYVLAGSRGDAPTIRECSI
jgi:hypothetical protein